MANILNPNFSWQQPSPLHPQVEIDSLNLSQKPAPQRPLPALPKDKKDSGCDFIKEKDNEDSQEENWKTLFEDSDSSRSQIIPTRAIKELKRTNNVPKGRRATARIRRDRRLLRRPSFIPQSTKEEAHPPPGRKEPRRRSVANNKRIQEIIQTKRIHPLATNIQESSTDDSDALMSPESTPAPASQKFNNPKRKMSLAPQLLRQDNDKFQLTPMESDVGVLAVLAAMPERTPSKRKLSAMPQFRSRNASVIELPSGSVVAVITPEQSAFQKSVYLPGKIVLERRSSGSPSSVLTPLDLLQETASPNADDDVKKRSEDILADDIVSFFEEFGPGFEINALNNDLDKFWDHSPVLKYRLSAPKMQWLRPTSVNLKQRQRGGIQPISDDENLPGESFSISFGSFDLGMTPGSPECTPDTDYYHDYRKRNSSIVRSSLGAEAFKSVPSSPDAPLRELPARAASSSSMRKSKPGKKALNHGSPRMLSFRRLLQSASTIV